jgi:hypothetical protein
MIVKKVKNKGFPALLKIQKKYLSIISSSETAWYLDNDVPLATLFGICI